MKIRFFFLAVSIALSATLSGATAADLPWPSTIASEVQEVRMASLPTGERAAAGAVNAFSSFGCVRSVSAAYGSEAEPFDSFALLRLFSEPIPFTTTSPGLFLIIR